VAIARSLKKGHPEPYAMSHTVVCVVGTRPEAIKMAPVILRLRELGAGLSVRILGTGQHRSLLDLALADFGLTPDRDLDLMRPGQGLAEMTARMLTAVSAALADERPDLVLAQGDTTTVLCTALACYYQQIPFGHVEAGLRTGQPYFPFPEEKNRALVGDLADLHFAPTAAARDNLLREGIGAAAIHVTGNTVIDALLMTARRNPAPPLRPETSRFVLVTVHRRENWGRPLEQVCDALRDLIQRNPDLSIVFPVHPNPRVRDVVNARLGRLPRTHLIDPAGYLGFVALMKACTVILTDSGGVQEEGPALGKPVLVMRDVTERPEGVDAGTAQLVGVQRESIVGAVELLWSDPIAYARFAKIANPYGDGRAAVRIARVLAERLGINPEGMCGARVREGHPEIGDASAHPTGFPQDQRPGIAHSR
jgi:UDP-N-acetylglucosamine 2-epimerase (non-hydrolysing)